jgi:glutathione synthase/RimK-type ligase-like ATP-grasp enzyme
MSKSLIILVGKDGRPSMRNVFSKMKSVAQLIVRRRIPNRGKEWLRVYDSGNAETFRKRPISELTMENVKCIRWGNRIEGETNEGTIVYNKAEAVANATDKKRSREMFIEGKVRCPRLVTPSDVKDSDFPIIARPNRHAKGKNFIVLKDKASFTSHYRANAQNGWYYSEFINKTAEFRVHCAHGKVLAVMQKTPGGDKIAWNRAQTGEPFTWVEQKDFPFSVCFQALKAVKVLGLDFAGVDVMQIEEKGKPQGYVLEVNTSPTLNSSDTVSERYAQYFDWLNRADKRREHWDFTKFEKAVSFAWKQFQLLEVENPNAKTEA